MIARRLLQQKPLKFQTIVITGASSGIGLATAALAAQRGANVVMSSRNAPVLERIAAGLRAKGGHVLAVAADVTKREDLENLRDRALEKFGRIDTWINNAGVSIYGPLLEVPESEERRLFETNFWGLRHGCHVAVGAMKDTGGTLINLGSELSDHSVPLQGMYAATKHAVKAYTDSLRMDLDRARVPVLVTLVRPAGIDTPYAQHAVNRLRMGEPSMPGPVYHPNVAARAILRAAESPHRDVYIGASARITGLLAALFPRTSDLFLEKFSVADQEAGDRRPHRPENEALLAVPVTDGRLRGGHRGRVMRSSLYTTTTQNPWRAAAALAVFLFGLGLVNHLA